MYLRRFNCIEVEVIHFYHGTAAVDSIARHMHEDDAVV